MAIVDVGHDHAAQIVTWVEGADLGGLEDSVQYGCHLRASPTA